MLRCERCLGALAPGWPVYDRGEEGLIHYFEHWCQQVRDDAAQGLFVCLQCGGTQCEAGTEDNCDKVWCRDCVDYTGDLPR